MSKPESKEKIKSFVEEMGIDMSEYKRPIEDYTSFNDFFYFLNILMYFVYSIYYNLSFPNLHVQFDIFYR